MTDTFAPLSVRQALTASIRRWGQRDIAGRVLMAGDPDPRQRALLAAAAVALMTAGDAGR